MDVLQPMTFQDTQLEIVNGYPMLVCGVDVLFQSNFRVRGEILSEALHQALWDQYQERVERTREGVRERDTRFLKSIRIKPVDEESVTTE